MSETGQHKLNPGDFQTAVAALCLDEPYSDADLNAAADAYEQEHGIPLIRPGEGDEDGRPNAAFSARLKKFKFQPTDPRRLTADPEVHKRELKKLLAIKARKGAKNLSDAEREAIHENEKALSYPLTDFGDAKTTVTAKDITSLATSTFKAVQSRSTSFTDRIAAIARLTDITTIELFASHDKSEDVRQAAFDRIKELTIANVPEE